MTAFNTLLAHGIRVGNERAKRRFKVTTHSRHDLSVSPNLLYRSATR